MKTKLKYSILLIILCLSAGTGALAEEMVDNSIYASLLAKHVHGSRVDYDGFKKDENLLDDYLAILSQTDAQVLSGNHQFAFYINVYNAFTIKLVLSKYPGINSIKEIGGFFSGPWSKKFIPLKKGTVSLDHIEHQILRPRFKDPRVHFAINCASKSCPPLQAEPYEGTNLDAQLDNQARAFINDTKNTHIKNDTLFVSKIFNWFKEDFSDAPLNFIKTFASKDLKEQIHLLDGNIRLDYLYYDWTLNR